MEATKVERKIMHSLIIDDEKDICQLLGNILRRRKIENDSANNIEDSKQLLGRQDFDLVFLDNYLPDGKGIDLVPYLKRTFPQLKIIMITASLNMVSSEFLNRKGIDWYLPKPLHAASINEVLDSLIKQDDSSKPKSSVMKRFTISFYLGQEKINASVKKSVVGTRTDYIVHPDSSALINKFGNEITLFKENENFSVNTSDDELFNDYVNAIATAIQNQD